MKKISYLFIAALLLSTLSLFAQKKNLTIEDFRNYRLYPEYMMNLSWVGDSDYFIFSQDNQLIQRHVTSKVDETLYTLEDFNQLLKKKDLSEMQSIPQIHVKDEKSFWFTHDHKIIHAYFKPKELRVISSYPQEAENNDVEPKTLQVAYTKGNNLYISSKQNEIAISNEVNTGIVYGQEVHRREFGISKGTFWSPKGNKLAFYKKDESMVTDYPLVDITTRIAELKNTKYPMAGMKSHHASVGVYNVKDGSYLYLQTGEPLEQYLTNVSWSPDEKNVFVAVLNRGQNHMKLNQYDAETGQFIKTLFEERNEKYVEPENLLYFLHKNKDEFIWFSERDGYNHLYLYNVSGKLIRQLTKGNWVVTELLAIDKNDEYAYFTATKESPLNNDVYRVNLQTGEISPIFTKAGTHAVQMNENGKYYIEQFQDTLTPALYQVVNTEGKWQQTLLESKNPLTDYEIGRSTIQTLKAENGTVLYHHLIYPPHFDASKKYPVFVYVYGGPHAQLVTNTWLGGANLFFNYMAEKGYIISILDNHGSANRGFAFESSVFRNLGQLEAQDQMLGINYLKSLSYVDKDSFYLQGWSFGGFLTMTLLTDYPNTFKAAVAGGPVVDWKYYEVMYGERYMDTPEENPEGYEKTSLLNKAGNLQDDLLIIHGAQDGTVVWQHTLDFLRKCVEQDVQVDYFVYPTHEHNVRGRDRLHLYKNIERYFEVHK